MPGGRTAAADRHAHGDLPDTRSPWQRDVSRGMAAAMALRARFYVQPFPQSVRGCAALSAASWLVVVDQAEPCRPAGVGGDCPRRWCVRRPWVARIGCGIGRDRHHRATAHAAACRSGWLPALWQRQIARSGRSGAGLGACGIARKRAGERQQLLCGRRGACYVGVVQVRGGPGCGDHQREITNGPTQTAPFRPDQGAAGSSARACSNAVFGAGWLCVCAPQITPDDAR